MSEKAHLLKVKATLKKRTPKFIRQDAHKHKRLGDAWRAPKGLHSKIRDSRRGYRYKLQGGYQSPAAVRGQNKDGLFPTLVANVADLAKLEPKTHGVILVAGLGGRKKIAVLEAATAKKFKVLNAKVDAAETLKSTWQKHSADKKAKLESKTEKQKALEAKAAAKAAKKDDAEGLDVKTEGSDTEKSAKHDHDAHTHAKPRDEKSTEKKDKN